jgi:O-antigen/teichoic acid export membrane protein
MAEVGSETAAAVPIPTAGTPILARTQFFKHSFVYGAAQVLIRGVSLFLLPLYTRVLSPTDYGIMDIIGIAVTFLTTAVSLEISQAVGRHYTEARDSEHRREIASTGLWFTAAAFSACAVLIVLFAPTISQWLLSTSVHADIIRVAGGGLLAQGLLYFTLEQLRWQLKPQYHAVVALAGSLTLIAATAVFVLVLHTGVIGIFYGQLVGNAPAIALALWFGREAYALRFDRNALREMLSFSVPLVPGTAAISAAFMIDRIAVRSLMSLAALGLYGIAYRFATLISLIMIGVNGAFMPLVFRHHRDRRTPRTIADIFRYFVCLATILFLTLTFFSGWILRVMTTPKYYGAADVVPLVVLAVTFSSMSIFAPGLLIAKQTRVVAAINVAATVLNAGLVFALVPYFGLAGAAIGTMVAFGTAFTAQMIMSQRRYPVPHAWRRLGVAAALTGASVAAFWFGARVAPGSEDARSLALEVVCTAAASIAVLAVLLRRDDIVAFKRVALGRRRLALD